MKKIIVASIVLAAASFSAFASNTIVNENVEIVNTDKKEVAISDLPEAVAKVLATDAYKNFKPVKATLVKGEVDVYEIEGNNEDGTQRTVKIDATGKVIS
jgi:uncharacterized membrane protein YkoI